MWEALDRPNFFVCVQDVKKNEKVVELDFVTEELHSIYTCANFQNVDGSPGGFLGYTSLAHWFSFSVCVAGKSKPQSFNIKGQK